MNQQEQLEEKDSEIYDLNQKISELNDIITDKERDIYDLEDRIERANNYIQEREREIENIIRQYS